MRSSSAAIRSMPLPDDGPVAALRRELMGRGGDLASHGDGLLHGVGEVAAAQRGASSVGSGRPARSPMRARQQEAGGDLGVERLRRRHAHLHVAPVGRVEHAVGLVGEVAVAPVDDGDRPSAPRSRTRSTVRLVSVVVPDWLMATTSVSLMSSRSPKPDSSVAGTADGAQLAVGAPAARSAAPGLAGEAAVPWPMTSDAADRPVADAATHVGRQRVVAELDGQPGRPLDELAPERLAERLAGASVISLSRKWG